MKHVFQICSGTHARKLYGKEAHKWFHAQCMRKNIRINNSATFQQDYGQLKFFVHLDA